jgi:hypothetical protein
VYQLVAFEVLNFWNQATGFTVMGGLSILVISFTIAAQQFFFSKPIEIGTMLEAGSPSLFVPRECEQLLFLHHLRNRSEADHPSHSLQICSRSPREKKLFN